MTKIVVDVDCFTSSSVHFLEVGTVCPPAACDLHGSGVRASLHFQFLALYARSRLIRTYDLVDSPWVPPGRFGELVLWIVFLVRVFDE